MTGPYEDAGVRMGEFRKRLAAIGLGTDAHTLQRPWAMGNTHMLVADGVLFELLGLAEKAMPDLSDPSASKLGPFVRESETSRRAALDAYPRQGSQRARILFALQPGIGGAQTREELAIGLGLSENTVRPRVKELIEGGWVKETVWTRKTTRGSDAVLVALTARALERDS